MTRLWRLLGQRKARCRGRGPSASDRMVALQAAKPVVVRVDVARGPDVGIEAVYEGGRLIKMRRYSPDEIVPLFSFEPKAESVLPLAVQPVEARPEMTEDEWLDVMRETPGG